MSILGRFPGLMTWVYDNFKYPEMQRIRQNKEEARSIARKLLDSKRQELKDGAPRKDVMSLLGLLSLSFTSSCVVVESPSSSQGQCFSAPGLEIVR